MKRIIKKRTSVFLHLLLLLLVPLICVRVRVLGLIVEVLGDVGVDSGSDRGLR
jgi:hypothetical protein